MGNCRYLVTTKDEADINCRIKGSLAKCRMSANTPVIVQRFLNINEIVFVYTDAHKKQLKEHDLVPRLEIVGGFVESEDAEIDFDEI
jgi:hypothetical protein